MEQDIQDQIKMGQNFLSGLLKSKLIVILLVVSFLFVLIHKSCITDIKPNQVGLKQISVSFLGRQGLQKKVYKPGWHFKIPIIQEFILFPNDILLYDLTYERRSDDNKSFFMEKHSIAQKNAPQYQYIPKQNYDVQGPANIQTNDGFYVKVDVSILFRIIDPYKVATVLGRTYNEFFQNGIARKAESVLKDSLGKLTTEEFYNSPLRMEKALEAKKLFNEKIAKEGLQIEHVLVRYFEYSHEIQKNIEEKKLKDQLVFKNQAEARAAIEEAKLKKVREEGEANIRVVMEGGQAYVTRKNAEKEAYVRKKRASGDLLYKLAEAKKVKLINNSYASKGSEKKVGLEMAKVLDGIELIVIPSDGKNGVNPLDLDKTMKLLGAE